MQTTKKTCFKCCTLKPLTDFYKHSRMADGHLNKCKICTKLDVSKHRHGAGRLKVLSYDRERAKSTHRKERALKIQERWRKSFPERRNAQLILGNAIKRGQVLKQPCFICGEKAEAHHPDYSSPLSVVWLCPAHHKQAHALHKKLLEGLWQSS